jgi:peptidyl-prolyl cis-trans isomerase B (cyclophilin B)
VCRSELTFYKESKLIKVEAVYRKKPFTFTDTPPSQAMVPCLSALLASLTPPQITSRARLDIAIGDVPPRPLLLGLYGDAAPKSVKLFECLCSGTLNVPGLQYTGSAISHIERGRIIIGGSPSGGTTRTAERSLDSTGYVRTEMLNRADAFRNDDTNALSHDRAGLLSMRKGGGAFEFGLTPAPNLMLDENRLVVGEAIGEESMWLIAELNEVPTRQPSALSELGGVASLYGLRLGLGLGFAGLIGQGLQLSRRDALLVTALGTASAAFVGSDPRDGVDLSYRPLKKVRIVRAQLLGDG